MNSAEMMEEEVEFQEVNKVAEDELRGDGWKGNI